MLENMSGVKNLLSKYRVTYILFMIGSHQTYKENYNKS
jgi:hypothetical protein